jgi:hypothetical protein
MSRYSAFVSGGLQLLGNLQEFLHMDGSKKAKYQDAKDDNM